MSTPDVIFFFSSTALSFFNMFYFYLCLLVNKRHNKTPAFLLSSTGICVSLFLSVLFFPIHIDISYKSIVCVFIVILFFILKRGLINPFYPTPNFFKPFHPVVVISILIFLLFQMYRQSIFKVNDNEQVLLINITEGISRPIIKKGYHIKLNFFHTVERFDTSPQLFQKVNHDCTLSNRKHLWTEIKGKWKIEDAQKFYRIMNTVESVNNTFLVINDSLCNVIFDINGEGNKIYLDEKTRKNIEDFYKRKKIDFINYGIEILEIEVHPFGKINIEK